MAYQPTRNRAVAATAALLVWAGLAALLLLGLAGHYVRPGGDTPLAVFNTAPPPPPPPSERTHPHPVLAKRPAGKAAPAGLKAKPTDLVVPPPVLPPPVPPPPVQVALAPGPGTASHAGNSDRPGPGPGAGGQGNGTGSGGDGEGDGDGGDTPPELRHGHLSARDWPHELGPILRDYVVGVRYTVDERGRVSACRITHSSGLPQIDQLTCDLIHQRFRFDPSRDASGRPVAADIVETHTFAPTRPGDRDGDDGY